MSLISGRASITRYRLMGPKKNWSLDRLNKLISNQKAPPLAMQRPIETQFGWDLPIIESEVTTGGHWDMSHCQLDESFVLRIRIDRKKVPATLLSELYKRELLKLADETLNKERRDEIHEALRQKLLQQALPTIKLLDVVWKVQESQVILFSTGTSDRDIFEELFRRTFSKELGLHLVQVTPPLMGLDDDGWKTGIEDNGRCQGLAKVLPSLYQESIPN